VNNQSNNNNNNLMSYNNAGATRIAEDNSRSSSQ
jgi:hypothetical protein